MPSFTRLALKRLLAGLFGYSPQIDSDTVHLRVNLEHVALIRHQDSAKESRNQDPAVAALLETVQQPSQGLSSPTFDSVHHRSDDASSLSSLSSLSGIDSDSDDAHHEPLPLQASKPVTPSHLPTFVPRRTKSLPHRTPVKPLPHGPPPLKRQRTGVDALTRPQVDYQSTSSPDLSSRLPDSSSSQQTPAKRKKLPRSHRKKLRHKRRLNVDEAETYFAQSTLAVENLPISTTWWMGTRFPSRAAELLKQAHKSLDRVWDRLRGITLIPYRDRATRLVDSKGRVIIFRSVVMPRVLDLMPAFIQQAKEFVAECNPITPSDIEGNHRGNHWFCIAGVDRNNKEDPAPSKWHKANEKHLIKAFAPGTPFSIINGIANSLLLSVFPGVAARFQEAAQYMTKKHKLPPDFGYYWNWCLNAVRTGVVDRVYCDPHVDFKNLALGICIVFVYGVFNHQEKAWLVVWEADIVLELPPGVFLLYSSSLFYHFNIDLDMTKIVTTPNGEKPTPENSTPLHQTRLQRPQTVSPEDWEAGNGRGSVVWFNQASMFQTSETGYPTLIKARKAGHTGNADADRFLNGKDAVFPPV